MIDRRGDQGTVRPHLKPEDKGKFAAIDIETGEYEIDADDLEAMERLGKRVLSAQIWLVRIGSRCVHHIRRRGRPAAS